MRTWVIVVGTIVCTVAVVLLAWFGILPWLQDRLDK